MCDYSLETHASRKARSGESLATAVLGSHKTVGLVSPREPDTAVCLCVGMRARVAVTELMAHDLRLPVGPQMATFGQRELPDGRADFRDGFIFDADPNVLHLLQDFDIDVGIELVASKVEAAPPANERLQARPRVLEDA